MPFEDDYGAIHQLSADLDFEVTRVNQRAKLAMNSGYSGPIVATAKFILRQNNLRAEIIYSYHMTIAL